MSYNRYTMPATHPPLRSMEWAALRYIPRFSRAIGYPAAIDELAAGFQATAERADTPEFQRARRRVALVVGESALLAALPMIPEETIIVADYWKNMNWFMRQHRNITRTASDATDWQKRIIKRVNRYAWDPVPGANARFMHGTWKNQIGDWEANGMTHPLHDAGHFAQAQQAAREKAIIPYRMDICNPRATARLGELLVARQATITFLNFTNVIEFGDHSSDAVLGCLGKLPLANDLPILASSLYAPRQPECQEFDLLGSLGPFYGLNDMRSIWENQ